MLHIIAISISYLSLLLLIMPATMVGIIQTLILFFIGITIIIKGKANHQRNQGYKQLVLAAVLIVIPLVINFYNRWLPSSKVYAIADLLHISSEILLLIISLFLFGGAVYVLIYAYYSVCEMMNNLNAKEMFVRDIFGCLLAAIATVSLCQMMIDVEVFSMGIFNFLWGVLIVSIVILGLYCLCGKIKLSIILGTSIFVFISTVNVYVYTFRGRLFEPVDILSFGTAMNVAENYSLFPIPSDIILGWGFWMGVMILLSGVYSRMTPAISKKNKLIIALCCVVGVISIVFYASNLKTYHWQREGAAFNGYVLDFVAKFKEAYIAKPDGYSKEKIEEVVEKYTMNTENVESAEYPHIIVIMDEAFSDLNVLGDISTNEEVMPFISSMNQNVVSGYALASVYGGNTANSEYEFLTGNSMAWLSPNVVPYQQYIQSSAYSMVSYLKMQYNYKCIAFHPYLADGWNRPNTYKNLGFDESLFIEDFPQENYVRNYISDQEMFEKIVDLYEKQYDTPLFLFGVSMQNHGNYEYTGENFNQSISLIGYEKEYSNVEQYLSLLHETDKAVEYLISYFSNVDDDVVIVFFGDHQPRIDEEFYNEIGAGDSKSLDSQQCRYKVPFFIWTNYDSEEKHIECTSLNYLSTYVYESAGISLPPYNQFLSKMEEKIPAINANGFYSLNSQCYLPFDEASDEEQEWLELYEILQYNSLLKAEERNQELFITLE